MTEERAKKIIRRPNFPSNLEDRLSAIVSCISTESKAILLGFCLDGHLRTSSDLHKLFRSRFIEEVWVPRHATLKEYAHNTFLPAGVIEEEDIYRDKVTNMRWRISNAGEKYGKPIAAFTLKWAVDNGISMHSILSSANSAGTTSSPFNRVRIINELELKKGKREADISRALNLKRELVGKHLSELKEIGFVNYEHISPHERGWAVYELVEGKSLRNITTDYVKNYPTLTGQIANYLFRNGLANCREIAEQIEYGSISLISNILSSLSQKGYIRSVNYVGGKKLSDAKLTEKGHKYKSEWVLRVTDALADEKELEDMQKEFGFLEVNNSRLSKYIVRGMELYEGASPNRNRVPVHSRQQEIIYFILQYELENGNGPRWIEIKKGVDCPNHGYLTQLCEGGILIKKDDESRPRYSINPDFKKDIV